VPQCADAQLLGAVKTRIKQRLYSAVAIAVSQPGLAENGVALAYKVIQSLLPLRALHIQRFQAGGGLGANHVHAQLAHRAFIGAGCAQGLGLLTQVLMNLRYQQRLHGLRQAFAQGFNVLRLVLVAEVRVVQDAQALQGEAVVALLGGKEGLVLGRAEKVSAQALCCVLAGPQAVDVCRCRKVLLKLDQRPLIVEVTLEQVQCLAARRLIQAVTDQCLYLGCDLRMILFACGAQVVVEQVTQLIADQQVAVGVGLQSAIHLGAAQGIGLRCAGSVGGAFAQQADWGCLSCRFRGELGLGWGGCGWG